MFATKRSWLALGVTLALAMVVTASSALAQGDAPNPSGGTIHQPVTVSSVNPGAGGADVLFGGFPMGFGLRHWVITELLARRFASTGPRLSLDGVRLAAIQRRAGVR